MYSAFLDSFAVEFQDVHSFGNNFSLNILRHDESREVEECFNDLMETASFQKNAYKDFFSLLMEDGKGMWNIFFESSTLLDTNPTYSNLSL